MEPKTHELKTINPFFQALWDGDMTYEFRRNDRLFKAWDRLILREFDPMTETYSGREVHRVINRVDILNGNFGEWLALSGMLFEVPKSEEGYAILSFTSTIEKVGE
jgi:hypothetical protein